MRKMNAFAAAINALFSDPNLSRAALYRAGGNGDGVEVRVIQRAPDRIGNYGEGRFVTDAVLIDVRISDINLLGRGDTFEIAGELFEVRSDPVRDSERLIWAAEVRAL